MTDTTTPTTADIVRTAIMNTNNTTGYDTADLDAGWRTPAVREAGMQFADDMGSPEMLYQHFTYGRDGCPAIGYQALAEEIAATMAYTLQDHDAISIARDIGAYPNNDIDAIEEFIRDPHDHGPGFGTSLEEIEETLRAVCVLMEDALPDQWEEDDENVTAYDTARDFIDDITTAQQDMYDDVQRAARS